MRICDRCGISEKKVNLGRILFEVMRFFDNSAPQKAFEVCESCRKDIISFIEKRHVNKAGKK